MIDIIFARMKSDADAPHGELWLIAASASDAGRRDMASLVVQRGLAGLKAGQTPITHVVVPCDTTRPTLDDMLAASLARLLAEGAALPAAAGQFAKYAALAREGLQPGDMPLESSMEGIFLAIRSAVGGELSEAAVGQQFAREWERMWAVIAPAIQSGADPFKADLFSQSAEFARERAFLKKDQDVYQEDVRSGQRFLVAVPGGPPSSALLVLDHPKSLLWKYWARRDTGAPTGGSYLLLAVRWEAGQWVISTDPVQRLPIKGLAEALQSAEQSADAASAKADPWFDGAPFGHTLVASPKAGSKLTDDQILKTIKTWAHAKHLASQKPKFLAGALRAAAATIVLVLAVTIAIKLSGHPQAAGPAAAPPQQAKIVDFRTRGAVLDDTQIQDLKSEGLHVPGYAVIVGVGQKQGAFSDLPASCRNARIFCELLIKYYGFDRDNIKLLTDTPKNPDDKDDPDLTADGMPTAEQVRKAVDEIGAKTGKYQDGSRTNFVFFYGGHGNPLTTYGDQKIGYLVLSGFKPTDPDNTGFDMGYLVKFISQRVASTHQILLIDCCYSGFVINSRGLDESNKSAIYSMWKNRARAVITAGKSDQESLEKGNRALFTSNLVEALTPDPYHNIPADKNHDGVVTDQELHDYLARTVSQEAETYSRHLDPQYVRALPDTNDDVGQYLFIPR